VVSERAIDPDSALVSAVIRWFDVHERPLPWRRTTPWGVLVSEFMLQQTPVDRVLPAWQRWMDRWPTAPDLADASVADALRAWERLGYPRRAKWLHESAVLVTRRFDGQVPSDEAVLRDLPGVGEYTAAAVRAFAYGRRAVVLDTNVRRVLARALSGSGTPLAHITVAERERMQALWPASDRRSARWSAAVMELGALVCTARTPDCDACPIRGRCAWYAAGRPAPVTAGRRQAAYEGSDRQARGRIMAVLRESPSPVPLSSLEASWPDSLQCGRALEALVGDGLVTALPDDRYALPGG
jgi:A/G-specific adenine glycosylase